MDFPVRPSTDPHILDNPLPLSRTSLGSVAGLRSTPLGLVCSMHMASSPRTLRYPPARRSDHVDIYKSHSKGKVAVIDPYNWLEQSSPETDEWINAQVAFSRSYIDSTPHRDDLEKQFTQNMNYVKFGAPRRKGDERWYWYHNTGLQAQFVICRSTGSTLPEISDGQKAEGEVFFDPNALTDDGTGAIAIASFSICGKYFAYGVSLSGSDFRSVYVRSTDEPVRSKFDLGPSHTGETDIDVVRFVKFSDITWTHDSKGFFYQRFPSRDHGSVNDDIAGTETEKDLNAMLYYHQVGTTQADDILVMKDPQNPTYMWSMDVSEKDGRFLALTVRKDTSRKNKIWLCDLTKSAIGPDMPWVKVVDEFKAAYGLMHNDGDLIYLRTNEDASNYKVVTINFAAPAERPKDFIAEDKHAFLDDVAPINGGNFVAVYTRDVKDELHVLSHEGKKLEQLAKDFVGSILINVERSSDRHLFTMMNGFTTPGLVVRFDFEELGSSKHKTSRWYNPKLQILDLNEFNAEQVWYNSKDGTRIPMFVVRHESTPRDGTAPAVLYGYGGFAISVAPAFNSSNLTFLKNYGAVFAVANIRGGAEYGEEWHQAGIKERKVNGLDDFIAAAEHIVQSKIAAPGKIAINGGSNGGLLVAACSNRAPANTFGAAVAQVGVLDLLKFDEFTIGRAWVSDFGNPKDAYDFDFIHPISPLHNIPTDRRLPPTFLQTADHDDRVVPLHSFKYAASLQHLQVDNPNPLLISIDRKAGHGAGKGTVQRIKELADKFAFVARAMNLKWQGELLN